MSNRFNPYIYSNCRVVVMLRIRMSSPWTAYLIRFADGMSIVLAGFLAFDAHQMLGLRSEYPKDLTGYYALISAAALVFAALPAGVYRS